MTQSVMELHGGVRQLEREREESAASDVQYCSLAHVLAFLRFIMFLVC